MAFEDIPIISLEPWRGTDAQRAELAQHVRSVCHEIGFFVLVDHGIDRAFMDRVFHTMEALFTLPEADKRLIDKVVSPHFRGWEAVGSEYTNNRPDMREQVDLWTDHEARAPDVEPHYLRLLGPNQYLPDSVLPGFEALLREWFDRMGQLATELTRVLSQALGLAPNHLDDLFGHQRMSLTKLISYPPTPDGHAGVNAHHDAGFLTVLAPGQTPGLEVQNPDGEWIPVPVIPDSFVINLGEMLQGMTGNYFVATPHRVITREARLSAGYFHGPALHTPLDPLPLAPEFAAAVDASPHHQGAGWMARREETVAGVGDMASSYKPAVYGEQLWNYFARSYPDNMARHHADLTPL